MAKPDPLTDQIRRVAEQRDKTAFAALFDHFAPRLKSYLVRLGADAASAEELTQEVMITLWRKAHLFDASRATAATWLFRIARNRRIDALRRDRSALLDKEDPSLRVTFDHLITCHPSDDYLSPGTRVGVPTLDPRRLVLEIKFDQSLPRWLQQRLVLEELRPIRYSKYVESALAFGLEQAV